MRALLAIFLLASSTAHAATIAGRLGYPSEGLPAMIVVARNSAGATFWVETKQGQARYRLEVPAGTYVVFAIPTGVGATTLRGAHTRQAGGPLAEVTLGATDRREDVNVEDWYLPDALMATLNLAASAAPPPKGSFEAYPADLNPPASTRLPDFAGSPELARHRARIQRAATRGPFFAGRVAVATWDCGTGCENWALIDMASGRIHYDDALQPLRGGWPCDAQALEFRDDSRLLLLHRAEGERVTTQEFLWSYEAQRLEKSGERSRSAADFCRR